jgi:hypothetical protein
MNLILQTIPKLLMICWIPFEIQNNIRSHHYEYSITILALLSVKCVTLWVRECKHDRDTLQSIISSGTWMYIITPTYSTKTFINSKNPVFNPLYLAIYYLPEIWSSISPYLVQSHSQQVLFTCIVIRYHIVIELINQVLASDVRYCIIEWAQSISLCRVE